MRKKNERILVVRDGDKSGSGGDTGLRAGLDHLLLEGAAISVPETPPYTLERDGAVVSVTDTPEGEDANSILQKNGIEALSRLIETRKRAELSFDGEFVLLSKLSAVEYDRVRKEAGKRLRIRLETLDGAVAACRPKPAADPGAARGGSGTVIAPEIEPSTEFVNGAELLDAIAKAIHRYIILDTHQADALALWSVFPYLIDRYDVSPKLIFKSAQKRSGKSRASDVVSRLVNRPLLASSITSAAFVRVIDRHCPTLFLDEFDAMMKGGGAEMSETLRGLLDSGFNRAHAHKILIEKSPDGGFEERKFSIFCAQVLSGIGNVKDTVADRSVTIELQRKKRTEPVARLRMRDGDDLRILARKIARFAADRGSEIESTKPVPLMELNDRAADAWEPLLAVADVAGGDWPRRARAAARKLSGDESESAATDTEETQLLSDIRDCFVLWKKADRLASADIVSFLVGLEERPWGDINRGRPLTKNNLARRLKPFHISPGTIWIGSDEGGYSIKGYKLDQFKDTFERYLSPTPSETADSTVIPSRGQDFRASQADFANVSEDVADVSETPEKPSVSAAHDGMTDEMHEMEGGAEKEAGEVPQPNGYDPAAEAIFKPIHLTRPTHREPRTQQEQDIVDYALSHPGISVATIAKTYGCPLKAVAELLGRPS